MASILKIDQLVDRLGTGPVTVPQGVLDANGRSIVAPFASVDTSITPLATPYINTDVTLNVETTGTTFTKLADAYNYACEFCISGTKTFTIQLGTGLFTETTYTAASGPFGRSILIRGATPFTTTTSAIVTSTGSAGAWTYTLTVASTSGITTDMCVNIYSSSGGTTPERLIGCHKVTSIDSATQMKILVRNRHTAAASGAVSATITVLPTVLYYPSSTYGFISGHNGMIRVRDVALLGNNTSGNGMYVEGGTIYAREGHFGIADFLTGVNAYDRSIVQLASATAISAASASGSSCLSANFSSYIMASNVKLCGGENQTVYAATGSVIRVDSARVEGGVTGIYATNHGYVYAAAAAVNHVTTQFSPAANTLGNEQSYIDT